MGCSKSMAIRVTSKCVLRSPATSADVPAICRFAVPFARPCGSCNMPEFSLIGKPAGMLDGNARVSGSALYTADMTLPGMLHGKILHSTLPQARLLRIVPSKAAELPGVSVVVDGVGCPIRL